MSLQEFDIKQNRPALHQVSTLLNASGHTFPVQERIDDRSGSQTVAAPNLVVHWISLSFGAGRNTCSPILIFGVALVTWVLATAGTQAISSSIVLALVSVFWSPALIIASLNTCCEGRLRTHLGLCSGAIVCASLHPHLDKSRI